MVLMTCLMSARVPSLSFRAAFWSIFMPDNRLGFENDRNTCLLCSRSRVSASQLHQLLPCVSRKMFNCNKKTRSPPPCQSDAVVPQRANLGILRVVRDANDGRLKNKARKGDTRTRHEWQCMKPKAKRRTNQLRCKPEWL